MRKQGETDRGRKVRSVELLRGTLVALVTTAGLTGLAVRAFAEDAPADASQTSFWQQSSILGDIGELRTWLANAGITFALQETSEVWGNLQGGIRTGAVYDGATLGSVSVDTGKAFGLAGGTFFVSAYQIHGREPTTDLVGSLQTVSAIEAERSTRLYDLYYTQSLFDGSLSIKIGQFGADEEFMISTYGALFLNSGFGFPTLPALDLPSGGPAYPLTTPGVRIRYNPTGDIALYAALFNGNPAPNGTGNPQLLNASGTTFRLNGGAFYIAEAQYAINQGDNAAGLPGTYKIGAWYNTNRFNDQHYDTVGVSLASPLSNGMPREDLNNWSIYATLDQLVWKRAGTVNQGIGLFARAMGAPSDRNLSNFFADGGITWKGIIPTRGDDTAGLGFGYVGVSPSVSALDRNIAFFSGTPYPIANHEVLIEATYQLQATPWLLVQPDVQYIVNPGGHVPNPAVPGAVIKNSFVLGLHVAATF